MELSLPWHWRGFEGSFQGWTVPSHSAKAQEKPGWSRGRAAGQLQGPTSHSSNSGTSPAWKSFLSQQLCSSSTLHIQTLPGDSWKIPFSDYFIYLSSGLPTLSSPAAARGPSSSDPAAALQHKVTQFPHTAASTQERLREFCRSDFPSPSWMLKGWECTLGCLSPWQSSAPGLCSPFGGANHTNQS